MTVADMMEQDLNRAIEKRDAARRALNTFLFPLERLRDQRVTLARRLAQGREDAARVGRGLPLVLIAAVEERLAALDAEMAELEASAAPLRAALEESEADCEAAAAASFVAEAL